MTVFRSIIFQVLFYFWTAVAAIAFLPVLIMPFWAISYFARLWPRGVFLLLRWIAGLDHRVEGSANIAEDTVIYAAKHQSAWDTMILPILLDDPVVVMKKELHAIPFYGWYARKYGTIGIDRKGGLSAIRSMLAEAREMIAQGRSIVVFPEGTRMAPGDVQTYQSGVAALYQDLDVPVVPIALNSGLFWGRRSLLRKPGTITIRMLPPIPPGLDRRIFMERLETEIETAQAELVVNETAKTAPATLSP